MFLNTFQTWKTINLKKKFKEREKSKFESANNSTMQERDDIKGNIFPNLLIAIKSNMDKITL